MANRDIVVVGASTGGVQAFIELARELPAHLNAAVFFVIHTSPASPNSLAGLLQRAGPLPAQRAENNQPIQKGRIYIAPPDFHMLLEHHRIRLTSGPKENGFRPAVDPLFRTAAAAFGPRVIGVVLSGALDDGTSGLEIIKAHGGLAIVQDPADAIMPGMPESAIQNVHVDYILPLAQIPAKLVELIRQPLRIKRGAAMARNNGVDIALHGDWALARGKNPGQPTGLTCPECGGAIWESQLGKALHYQCHVGHFFSLESLIAEQARDLEAALWTAVRTLEENAEFRRRLARRARELHHTSVVKNLEQKAAQAQANALFVRNVLENSHFTHASNGKSKIKSKNNRAKHRTQRRRKTPAFTSRKII